MHLTVFLSIHDVVDTSLAQEAFPLWLWTFLDLVLVMHGMQNFFDLLWEWLCTLAVDFKSSFLSLIIELDPEYKI